MEKLLFSINNFWNIKETGYELGLMGLAIFLMLILDKKIKKERKNRIITIIICFLAICLNTLGLVFGNNFTFLSLIFYLYFLFMLICLTVYKFKKK